MPSDPNTADIADDHSEFLGNLLLLIVGGNDTTRREEIVQRFHAVEQAGEPGRVRSNFVHGYTSLPVRLRAF